MEGFSVYVVLLFIVALPVTLFALSLRAAYLSRKDKERSKRE
jgi:hypothetical protein